MNNKPPTVTGIIAVIWSVLGLLILLGFAVWQLCSNTIAAFQMPLNWTHWLIFTLFFVFMAYSEGYKGFQKRFSPRFAARAKHLLRNPTLLHLLLAPLFCMGYFHATKKRIIATFSLTVMIVIFVLSFQFMPQPWRGILDAGIVIGLIWGMIATVLFYIKAFTDDQYSCDPELPETP